MLPVADWKFAHQPPYYYWMYYLATNIRSLNDYRASRGMTVFSFRYVWRSVFPSMLDCVNE